MLLHRPVRKLKHLLHRFAAMEARVIGIEGRLAELQQQQLAGLEAENDSFRRSELAAETQFRELRGSVHLAARRAAPGRRPTKALFLVHHIEAWDSYHDLVEAMRSSADFDPVVTTVPRHFHGYDGFSYEEEIHRGLEARGVPHLRLPMQRAGESLQLIKAIDPDLVFRQSQWDADVPPDVRTEELTFARLCLVPYETMNLLQNVPPPEGGNSAVDSALHRVAWAVFCTNDLMLDMARADNARAGQHFRVTGHPKADRIRRAVPSWPLPERPGHREVRRIVWSAHHSIGSKWANFGAFPTMADDMLTWATEDPTTEFVLMPHPALFAFVRSGSPDSPLTSDALDRWLERWGALPNTAVFTDGDYPPLLAASDLLITDGLSMLVEYQLLSRPVIFVERPDHRPFTTIGELVRTGTHAVGTVAEARARDQHLREGADPLRGRQAQNVERLFGTGSSVERILSALRQLLAAEAGEPSGGATAGAADGDAPVIR